ncbi:uncharacterized protein LOC131284783 [Anopheles ziemanni]|uniref:uncharacterized protein LOC131261473 n=1 Tax=Anopheles coustani TaxID=139045 RepID=UPI0026597797|nr:uncharacterized protein LOC131261473 [Anopheles coustani]XP_058169625.1 uncharacterized protein LOC131284783 [Anopheles ziemanni]
MKQRVAPMLLGGLLVAACLMLHEVRSDADLYGHAEPSHHVMHIRKLSDSDKLKIELEPVWFHLESAEQLPAKGESQQVKRQTKSNTGRPVQVFTSLSHLERYRRKNHYTSSEADDAPESYLKDFWHADVPSEVPSGRDRSYEVTPKSTSLEDQLEEIELPSCFRRYLHEMYDRNNESVRKLMRCLSQHPEEKCLEAQRRAQRYRGGESREDDPRQALYERKVIRRRKFSDHRDNPRPMVADDEEDLRFEKHFIRSDSDDVGQVFNPATDENDSESGSNDSGSDSDEGPCRHNEVRTPQQDSEEPERKEAPKYDHREPYRRPPPKYNTQRRRRDSAESEEDGSSEASDESCENC